MNITEKFLPIGSKCRSGYALPKVDSITIHWIGPYPNQTVYSPYYWWRDGSDGKGVEASAHYIVKGNDVLHCIPDDEVAWHCGNREGNYSSIGIEVVPRDVDGRFDNTTISTLKELLAQLPPVSLKRHYDWTGKDCPRFYTPLGKGGDLAWSDLLQEVKDGRR
jgi:hypothetical protein